MKGVIKAAAREFKLIFRDGITIYLAISPALLALVFVFVFGRVQDSSISFVVDKSFPVQMAEKLDAVADIEYADDVDGLMKRIGGADSIAGVYIKNGHVTMVVEGNEAQGFTESRQALLRAALSNAGIQYKSESIDGQNSLAFEISMACIFLLALFIGGAALGLGGVGERESGVIKAISVSPMALLGYVVSKIIPALLMGILSAALCALVMGRAPEMPLYIMLAVCSVFVSGIISFLIIAFADNQIAAAGVLKIVMPLFLVVGISAAFVPDKWHAFYFALPMYWQYAAINAIGSGSAALQPLLMILATGLPWFLIVLLVFSKKTMLKFRR